MLLLAESMSGRPSIPAKEIRGTTAALDNFTRRILSVPHSAIKAELDAEKAAKGKTRNVSSRRASASSPKRAN